MNREKMRKKCMRFYRKLIGKIKYMDTTFEQKLKPQNCVQSNCYGIVQETLNRTFCFHQNFCRRITKSISNTSPVTSMSAFYVLIAQLCFTFVGNISTLQYSFSYNYHIWLCICRHILEKWLKKIPLALICDVVSTFNANGDSEISSFLIRKNSLIH